MQTPRQTLRDVLAGQPATLRGRDDVTVAGVSADSRSLRPGEIFVAVRGLHDDGRLYVQDAVARGAAAVVSEHPPPGQAPVPWAVVPDARAALGWLAASLHDFPARQLGVIGITGTDGKTTTAHLIASLLEAGGWPVGLISTVQVKLGSEVRPNDTDHTTPPAPLLQPLLAEMVLRRVRWTVLEVTSHALDQQRIVGCDLDVGVFTNLTPEHLNYHGDFGRYRDAKTRLFDLLGEQSKPGIQPVGLFNADDPNSPALRSACRVAQVTYGLDRPADYRVSAFRERGESTVIQLETPNGRLDLTAPMVGRFNLDNAAAACATALHLGVSSEAVAEGIKRFPGVPGRLQRIDLGQPFEVVIDFAHTPNALRATLQTLRPRTRRRLIVVFGHPGGRDPHNRRSLAQVAAAVADFLVVTGDDPYDEDPVAIVDQIERTVRRTGLIPQRDFLRVDDRTAAIDKAVRLAGPGDTVLIAGRGHLEYTVVRGQKLPLSDVDLARRSIRTSAAARAAS